jgi:hypothetical protein
VDESETEALHGGGSGDGPSSSALCHSRSINRTEALEGDDEDSKFVSSPSNRCPIRPEKSKSKGIEWIDLSLSTLLHMVYVTLGYTLMLAVMTWNVWILVAVAIGIGLGYLFFGAVRHSQERLLNRRSLGRGDECCDDLLPTGRNGRAANGSSDNSTASTSTSRLNHKTEEEADEGFSQEEGPGSGAGDGPPLHHRLTVGAQVHT